MTTPQERTRVAMEALGFTEKELALNRSGRLSKRQRKSARGNWGRATKLSELLAIMVIERPLWTFGALLRRMLGKEVDMVEGVVEHVKERGYHLVMGEYRFSMNRAMVESFEDGARYRLYFDAHPKRIVSYDVLSDPTLFSAEGV